MSSTGRKRMMFATSKSVIGTVIACVCLWAGFEVFRTWQENPAKLKAPVKTSPVKNVALRGENLVLDQPWVVRTLALPKNADLVALDLFALRDRLLASGQVKAAVLTRKFPDTLVVSLEERSPVARVNARFGDSEPETYLVSRDGVVYQGSCYKDELIQSLPFLAGVSLRRSNGKLLPIDGMEQVAELLTTARANAPALYHSWAVISLEKFPTDGQILVQTTDAGTVIFGTRDDFYKQIARLDYILDEAKKNPAIAPLKTINLAVGAQVPVSFETPAPEDTPAQPAPALRSARPTSHPNTPNLAKPAAAHPHAIRSAPRRPLQANSTSTHRPSRRDF